MTVHGDSPDQRLIAGVASMEGDHAGNRGDGLPFRLNPLRKPTDLE